MIIPVAKHVLAQPGKGKNSHRWNIQFRWQVYIIFTANGDEVYDIGENRRSSTAYLTRVVTAVFRLKICNKCWLVYMLQARSQREGVGAVGRPPLPALKGHFSADCSSANTLNIIRLWNKINKVEYHVDSSFDHKVTSSIIILKIEVSPRQPLETPIFKPWKGPKSEENDPPLPEGWLRAWCAFCRATMCIARPIPSCGVRPSVCLSVTFRYCVEMT